MLTYFFAWLGGGIITAALFGLTFGRVIKFAEDECERDGLS
jgi:hypothetical protein